MAPGRGLVSVRDSLDLSKDGWSLPSSGRGALAREGRGRPGGGPAGAG